MKLWQMGLSQDKVVLLKQVKNKGTVKGHFSKTITSAVASGFIKKVGLFYKITYAGEKKLSE